MHPPDIERRFESALEKARTGDAAAGVADLAALVEDCPEHSDAWGNLAYLLQMTGRAREAARSYERYLELRPGNPEALERLGDCYYTLGDREKAYGAYRALDANSDRVRQRLSMTEPFYRWLPAHGGKLFRGLLPRLLDLRFIAAFSRELFLFPAAFPILRNSRVSVFFNYLSEHYLAHASYRFPLNPCDLCGGRKLKPVFFYLGQKKVKCEGCGLEFVERKPPESQDVLEDWYNQEASIEYMEGNWQNETYFKHRIEMLEGAFEEAGLPFPQSGERLFEIGCAQGHVLEYFCQRGLKVEGIETGAKIAEYCRDKKNLNVTCSTVRGFEPADKKFDYLFAYHVLEHLERPSELFEKARAMLKEGGLLFIEVPTAKLTDLSLAEQLDEYHGYGNLGHMHYFHMDTLAAYFEKFGFEPIASYEYHTETLPSGGILGRMEVPE